MRVTTVSCDHCTKIVTDGDIHNVALTIGPMTYNATAFKAEEWCRDCLIGVLGVGWRRSKGSTATPPQTPPTLEDMIREIAGEAAIEAVRNR